MLECEVKPGSGMLKSERSNTENREECGRLCKDKKSGKSRRASEERAKSKMREYVLVRVSETQTTEKGM